MNALKPPKFPEDREEITSGKKLKQALDNIKSFKPPYSLTQQIIEAAHEAYPYDSEGIPDSHSYSFCQGAEWAIKEIKRRHQIIMSEPNGIIRETMINNLLIDFE